jgi:hypothetical protein
MVWIGECTRRWEWIDGGELAVGIDAENGREEGEWNFMDVLEDSRWRT